MTREEKEKLIRHLRHNLEIGSDFLITDKDVVEIIKALEQEPILDKIRAEIMQLDYDIDTVYYDYNDMPQTETVHIICREEVFRIIDEYKAESEE